MYEIAGIPILQNIFLFSAEKCLEAANLKEYTYCLTAEDVHGYIVHLLTTGEPDK